MSGTFHQQLNQIITLSQQILDELNNNLETKSESKSEFNEEAIIQWSVERDKLIKLTFTEEQAKNYNQYLSLINQLLALDKQLNEEALSKKSTLQSTLINLKKNKKATDTYNKF